MWSKDLFSSIRTKMWSMALMEPPFLYDPVKQDRNLEWAWQNPKVQYTAGSHAVNRESRTKSRFSNEPVDCFLAGVCCVDR
jgi:hypothetical protein